MNFNKSFESIGKHIAKEADSFTFNTSDLPHHKGFKTEIVLDSKFTPLFKLLARVDTNAVYWFEADSNLEANKLVAEFERIRDGLHKRRTLPPKNKNENSPVLYVGKRQGGKKKDGWTHISGRMVQHLGYYPVGSTQGLQLIHWAKNLKVKITIRVYQFEGVSNGNLKAIENILSDSLKPLLGRH